MILEIFYHNIRPSQPTVEFAKARLLVLLVAIIQEISITANTIDGVICVLPDWIGGTPTTRMTSSRSWLFPICNDEKDQRNETLKNIHVVSKLYANSTSFSSNNQNLEML